MRTAGTSLVAVKSAESLLAVGTSTVFLREFYSRDSRVGKPVRRVGPAEGSSLRASLSRFHSTTCNTSTSTDSRLQPDVWCIALLSQVSCTPFLSCLPIPFLHQTSLELLTSSRFSPTTLCSRRVALQ